MRSFSFGLHTFTSLSSLFFILLSFLWVGAAQAATLVVKIKASNADEALLNNKVATPAGLKKGYTYHVTLGFIINVPKQQAKTLKYQLYAFLRKAHNPKKDPIRFNVQRASTWGAEHNPYYGANTVILLPSNTAIFKSLNAQIANYLLPLRFAGVQLDPATVPPHYTPHITMKGPKSGTSVNQAVSNMNQYLSTHSVIVHLNEYRISIQ